MLWTNPNEDKMICYCKEVMQNVINASIKKGNHTLEKIKEDTQACTGNECSTLNPSGKCCSRDIKNLIHLESTKGII